MWQRVKNIIELSKYHPEKGELVREEEQDPKGLAKIVKEPEIIFTDDTNQ